MSGTLILALGIWDDIKGLRAGMKLPVEIIAAIILYMYGYKITLVTNPFGNPIELGWLGIFITILWVVGITNAMNLIDGLDGLAAGVATIVSFVLFLIGVIRYDITMSFLTLALAGTLVGFLKYNFNPATIFMGDSGALFIGFTLAAIGILSNFKSATAVTILTPIIALGLPIMDTFMAIVRRVRRGENPLTHADDEHIHHKLLGIGLSQRQAVLVLYIVTFILGGVALAFTAIHDQRIAIILVIVGIVVFIGIRRLGFIEYEQLKKMIDRWRGKRNTS
ncbi:MAG: MraY family glycosyltransferase [bacterium]